MVVESRIYQVYDITRFVGRWIPLVSPSEPKVDLSTVPNDPRLKFNKILANSESKVESV